MDFLTITQAADDYHVSRQWVYEWLRRNNLLGGCLRHRGAAGHTAFLLIPAKLLTNFPSKKNDQGKR